MENPIICALIATLGTWAMTAAGAENFGAAAFERKIKMSLQ